MNENRRKVTIVLGAKGGIGSACLGVISDGIVVGLDLPEFDITKQGIAADIVARVYEEHGALTGVVHAVGMSGRRLGDGAVDTCTDEAWEEVLQVNLTSVFWLMRASLPAIARSGGGSFVSIGSVLASSQHPDFLTTAYATAKSGLIGLTRAAALAIADRDVRVNLVSPSLVDTPMAQRALSTPSITSQFAELLPLGQTPLAPRDVADAVRWLLSDGSRRVTGTEITVDGGWSLR